MFTYDYIGTTGAAQASITAGINGPTSIYVCSSTYPTLNTSNINYPEGVVFPEISIDDCYNAAGGCTGCGT